MKAARLSQLAHQPMVSVEDKALTLSGRMGLAQLYRRAIGDDRALLCAASAQDPRPDPRKPAGAGAAPAGTALGLGN